MSQLLSFLQLDLFDFWNYALGRVGIFCCKLFLLQLGHLISGIMLYVCSKLMDIPRACIFIFKTNWEFIMSPESDGLNVIFGVDIWSFKSWGLFSEAGAGLCTQSWPSVAAACSRS